MTHPKKWYIIMARIFSLGLLILCAEILIAQKSDLTSVDEFLKVTSVLREGKEISEEQWRDFDNSRGYRGFAEREDKSLINTIKSSINIAFDNVAISEKDSILSITQEEMNRNTTMLLKKLILTNYLNVCDNYESIESFRENYDFDALIEKSKQRLGSFLGSPLDSTIEFKPIYFLFITADGMAKDDALYIDFNLVYKMTEEQRVNFIAHEFFHNYREKHESHDFNYKNDLNHCLDLIQNEGIADMIDKSEGYETYFTSTGELPEMVETWVSLYNQAQEDLEKLHGLIIKYAKGGIREKEMVDELLEIVKYNGHPIGFYMANNIESGGYEKEMLETFYNPYDFFNLYNKVAIEQNLFQLSDKFMDYMKGLTKEYYR